MAHTSLLDMTDGCVWTSDSSFYLSFRKGYVITVQINRNSAPGPSAHKGKGEEKKHTLCAPRQLHSMGAGCKHRRLRNLWSSSVEGLLTPWKREQRGQTLCCDSGRCSTENPAPGDAEQRWLQALCATWILAVAWAAEAPDTHLGSRSLLWLEVGLPEMPRFAVPWFRAVTRSFIASITFCPLRQGCSHLRSMHWFDMRVAGCWAGPSPWAGVACIVFYLRHDELSGSTGNSLLTALGKAEHYLYFSILY